MSHFVYVCHLHQKFLWNMYAEGFISLVITGRVKISHLVEILTHCLAQI